MSENEFYHVRITTKSNRWSDEIKLDLSKEQLTERFLSPYESGDIITVNGKQIKPDDITRFKISKTSENSARLLPQIIAEKRANSRVISGNSDQWLSLIH